MLDRLAKLSLPLRAVAMVLFSAAVVFFLLGVHAWANSGEEVDPLRAAADQASAASASARASATPVSTAEPAPATVCVYNFSTRKGWASQVGQALRDKGFKTDVPDNYREFKVDGPVVYFNQGYENQANKAAEASGVSPPPKAQPRPADVTLCPDGITLILWA